MSETHTHASRGRQVDTDDDVVLTDATAKTVIAADVFTANGIIHIVDGVLLY